LVLRADIHDINGTVCTGCREISTCVAIIIYVAHALIEALTARKRDDCASKNKAVGHAHQGLLRRAILAQKWFGLLQDQA
jgi:hypothetical protein